MTFTRNIMLRTAMLLLAALTLAPGAKAQLLLPSQSHNNFHNDLLANQRTITNQLRFDNNPGLMRDVLNREAGANAADLVDDYDLFDLNWESERVNAYEGMTIPATADIDVSEFVMPLDKVNVTSNYGYRPRFGRVHRGTDMSLRTGDTVRAAFTGKVRLTKYERAGYGYYVVMRHPNGLETVYGHLSRFLVKPGQWLKAGDPIALGGNTGRSTGPHLHFETRYMGLAINPAMIVDFDNGGVISDIFAFEKAVVDKQGKSYAKSKGKRRATHKASASKKKRSGKAAKTSKKKRRR